MDTETAERGAWWSGAAMILLGFVSGLCYDDWCRAFTFGAVGAMACGTVDRLRAERNRA